MAATPRAGDAVRRILAKAELDTESGCWVWRGALSGNGYGQTRLDGKAFRVHRAIYTLLVGPIPEGLVVDHLCRRRLCINLAHLEAVTQSVNVLRGRTPSAVRARSAQQTHCTRGGHPLSGDNLRINATGWRACKACAREAARRHYYKKKEAM